MVLGAPFVCPRSGRVQPLASERLRSEGLLKETK